MTKRHIDWRTSLIEKNVLGNSEITRVQARACVFFAERLGPKEPLPVDFGHLLLTCKFIDSVFIIICWFISLWVHVLTNENYPNTIDSEC